MLDQLHLPHPLRRPAKLSAALLALLASLALAPLAGSASAAEFGKLETLAPSPVPLTALAVDPTTNFIYGLQFEGTRAFRYDPYTNAWSELSEAAIDIGNNGGATYLDGKIYMSSTSAETPMEVYDIATQTWSTVPNPLSPLGTADITNTGGELYLADANTLVRYNPVTEATTTLAEPPRFLSATSYPYCATIGFEPWGGLQVDAGKIYGDQGDGCNGFAVYDIASNSWSELPVVPAGEGEEEGPVAGSAFDPVSQSFFAYGDYEGHSLYRYSVTEHKWTLYTLPFAVNDGGLVYVSEPGRRGIYAIQGQEGTEFIRYTTPEPSSDLSLETSATPGSAVVGQDVTYTLTVSNHGPYATSGVSTTTTLPAGVTLVSTASSQGSCSGTTTILCSLGSLGDGETATVTIVVDPSASGAATVSSSVSSESPDPVPANNSSSATATIARAGAPTPATVPAPTLCYSARSETVHWRLPAHVGQASATVTVNGTLVARLSSGARSATVSMARMHGGTVTVTVTALSHTGARYQTVRVFHPCTSKHLKRSPGSLYLHAARSHRR